VVSEQYHPVTREDPVCLKSPSYALCISRKFAESSLCAVLGVDERYALRMNNSSLGKQGG
jgi:hypothetical protein